MPLLNSYFMARSNNTTGRNQGEPTERLTYRLRDLWGNWRDLGQQEISWMENIFYSFRGI
jgi:hypothetical protein